MRAKLGMDKMLFHIAEVSKLEGIHLEQRVRS